MTVSTRATLKTVEYGGTALLIRFDMSEGINNYLRNNVGPIDPVELIFLCSEGSLKSGNRAVAVRREGRPDWYRD